MTFWGAAKILGLVNAKLSTYAGLRTASIDIIALCDTAL